MILTCYPSCPSPTVSDRLAHVNQRSDAPGFLPHTGADTVGEATLAGLFFAGGSVFFFTSRIRRRRR